MKTLVLIAAILCAGCATGIKSTLSDAKKECTTMKATIKNIDGKEYVVIRCFWDDTDGENW